MIVKDQKLKKKNLWTAVGLVAFIVFLFIFTLLILEYLKDLYD